MAKRYYIGYTGASGSASYHQLCVYQAAASPLQRPVIFEFKIGSHASPVDQAGEYTVVRSTTAAPTGGSTPAVGILDTADPAPAASNTTAYSSATGGETMATTLDMVGLHQKATFRFVTDPTMGYVIPITQYAGLGIQIVAQSAAFNTDISLFWTE